MGNPREKRAPGPRRGHVLPLAVLLLAGVVAHGAWTSTDMSAASGSAVGFVDVGRLIDDYLGPAVDGPLMAETMRLQAEFEELAQDLDDGAAEALFERYQAMLNLIKHDLIEAQLPVVNAAVEAVASQEAITVVLDKQAVIHGGIDLTDKVLDYLQDGVGKDQG